MTLTIVVGASGSGKTTFLNDVHKFHQCIYIRQYHNLRPYIPVSAIPNFDPTQLPYWEIYVRENKDNSIIVGGTIGGTFMAGLSGGQRKLLLLEIIFQRTATQDNLLIVLDEPFAGVTDEFVPFIEKRLNQMRTKHNILLVTNDHVSTLKKMADNCIVVSAINRSVVAINEIKSDRNMVIASMSQGNNFVPSANMEDLVFFCKVEFSKDGGIFQAACSAIMYFGVFCITFWNSKPGSEPFILEAAGSIAYFCVNPYLISLCDWRIYITEEADAIMHSSTCRCKILKFLLTFLLAVIMISVQYVCQDIVIGTMSSVKFYVAFQLSGLTSFIAFILLGLFSDLPLEGVQVVGCISVLGSMLLSTVYSPGSGLKGIKDLRYLFPRFYLWCMIPVELGLEGCPQENSLLFLILTSLIFPTLFLLWKFSKTIVKAVESHLFCFSNDQVVIRDDGDGLWTPLTRTGGQQA